ncbi:MAG: NUDIX domain-containing protein [Anaerolineae bacterium]|nr:NUDIX domain-containing protein [Anaerolineae bacterium]
MTQINHRVRALLLTPRHTLMMMKRVRDGVSPYYVAPGGGVEPIDASLEAALHREIAEELGGTVTIVREVFRTEHPGETDLIGWTVQHHYFICHLLGYDLSQRNGPEFSNPAKGQYIPEEFPLIRDSFIDLNILPAELGHFLASNVELLQEAF